MIHFITGVDFFKQAIKKDINFLAWVMTPWHVVSMDSSIKYLTSIGVNIQGMVMIYPHPQTGYCVDESCFTCDCYEIYKPSVIQETVKEPSKSFLDRFVSARYNHTLFYLYILFGGYNFRNKQVVYTFAPAFPNTRWGYEMYKYGKHVKYVIGDEGVATYMFHEANPPHFFESKYISKILSYFRNVIMAHKAACIFHNLVHCESLIKHNDNITVNKKMMPHYKSVLSFLNKKNDIKYTSGSVIICSSIFDGSRQSLEEYNIILKICEKISEAGIKIFLKTHPRDTEYKNHLRSLNCSLIEPQTLSIEGMLSNSSPICIIGFSSTALVSSSIFYSIQTISLSHLIPSDCLTAESQRDIEYYKKIFNNIVLFPKSINDCINIIKNICEQ